MHFVLSTWRTAVVTHMLLNAAMELLVARLVLKSRRSVTSLTEVAFAEALRVRASVEGAPETYSQVEREVVLWLLRFLNRPMCRELCYSACATLFHSCALWCAKKLAHQQEFVPTLIHSLRHCTHKKAHAHVHAGTHTHTGSTQERAPQQGSPG